MKWLTNIYDPKRKNAKYSLPVQLNQNRNIEWGRRLAWLARHEIGRPKASMQHSVEALEAMGYVGVYQKDIGESNGP